MAVHSDRASAAAGDRKPDASERASRTVEVNAASFDDGKRLVQEQLPDGWVVASWTVNRPTP